MILADMAHALLIEIGVSMVKANAHIIRYYEYQLTLAAKAKIALEHWQQ